MTSSDLIGAWAFGVSKLRLLSASLLVVVLTTTGCSIPNDPEGTLERVSGGIMRVGLIESEPWASVDADEATGVEVALVEAFAREIDADIEWFPGSESEVMEALHLGILDIVIGGIVSSSPYSKEVAFTHPYLTTQTVVGFPDESGIDEDIAGLEVAVENGTAEEGMLEKTDAVPVLVDDIAEIEGPRVAENWELDDLGLIDLGVQLSESDHVMAVHPGENAFMVRLERFLLENVELVRAELEEAQP